jgi:cell division protein FtsB
VLGLVVGLLAITLAYPLREYVGQRAEIAGLRESTAAQQRRVAELEAQRERWRDPAYVQAQARERLNFVLPGETRYVVLEPDEAPAPGVPGRVRVIPGRPWFGALWESVVAADGGR